MTTIWCDEVHQGQVRFGLSIKAILHDEQSAFQRIQIVDTEMYGRALLLDGLWMTSEGEEFLYHEMIVQSALCTAKSPRRVLIIGGGDGGSAREALRHDDVEKVTMVEIDQAVVDACREHMPTIGASAWDDPRLDLRAEDGISFVREGTGGPYDVIIIDGSDPVGPAEGLFNREFFASCANLLADGGVMVGQAESPMKPMRAIHVDLINTVRQVLPDTRPFYFPVVLYGQGHWSGFWGSRGRHPTQDLDLERVARVETYSRYYNRAIHRGAFAVPQEVARALEIEQI